MADQIQGRDVTIKVYQAGRLVKGIPVAKFDDEAKQDMRERDLLGEARSQNQLLIHGYKGTLSFDVESSAADDLAHFINEVDKSGISSEVTGPVGKVPYEFAIQVKKNYRDGTSSSYRFVRVRFMIPKNSIGGRKEDVTGTIEWHAEDKVKA